jgi:hypothetical protein
MAHSMMAMLRTVIGFGSKILEKDECIRVSTVLHESRFPVSKAREVHLTAEHAAAVRAQAHAAGRPSIALAQAIQFECILRQKDVIGEYVPQTEAGITDVIRGNDKWLRGIRWEEIDDNLTLTHVTSKRLKEISVDLKMAPMVIEELHRRFPGFLEIVRDGEAERLVVHRDRLPASGPIIVSESTDLPWMAPEFRRVWRELADKAGVPKNVRNMDSRAGAITEATDAGADIEHVRHAATHSDIKQTQKYSRGQNDKVVNVQQKRVAHRSRNAS